MHHYNFPQYCGKQVIHGAPGRREEVDAVLLDATYLAQVLPSGRIPYAIRLVEVLESNGSSSQASGTPAHVAGGVPISLVAGIAMVDQVKQHYTVLTTDIRFGRPLEIWTSGLLELVTRSQPFKWISRSRDYCRNLGEACSNTKTRLESLV